MTWNDLRIISPKHKPHWSAVIEQFRTSQWMIDNDEFSCILLNPHSTVEKAETGKKIEKRKQEKRRTWEWERERERENKHESKSKRNERQKGDPENQKEREKKHGTWSEKGKNKANLISNVKDFQDTRIKTMPDFQCQPRLGSSTIRAHTQDAIFVVGHHLRSHCGKAWHECWDYTPVN